MLAFFEISQVPTDGRWQMTFAPHGSLLKPCIFFRFSANYFFITILYETLTEAKRYNQSIEIHLLIPVRTDTTYFHEYIYPYATLHFIRGRLKFRDLTGVSKKPTNAPFPSMVCVYQHV